MVSRCAKQKNGLINFLIGLDFNGKVLFTVKAIKSVLRTQHVIFTVNDVKVGGGFL